MSSRLHLPFNRFREEIERESASFQIQTNGEEGAVTIIFKEVKGASKIKCRKLEFAGVTSSNTREKIERELDKEG